MIEYECEVCGGRQEGDGPCCFFCWWTGRYFDYVLCSDDRENLLTRIRNLEHVVRAEVWHQGNGGFILAIELDDGRIMFPGSPGEVGGNKVSFPAIPPMGTMWRVNVATIEKEEVSTMPDDVDDNGLVKAVQEISELGAALG